MISRGLLALLTLLSLAACTGLAEQTDPGLLFAEEFLAGGSGSWQTETDALGQSSIADGRLLIEINTPQVMQFATLTEPLFTDFIMEVDAVQLAGSPESSYGILFRMTDDRHFYRFDITGSGLFVVEKHTAEAGWSRLTDGWQTTTAVNGGLGNVNRLKVAADGALLTFYVNDEQIYQLQDGGFTSGRIALDAGTFGGAGLQVAFDNLVVRRSE